MMRWRTDLSDGGDRRRRRNEPRALDAMVRLPTVLLMLTVLPVVSGAIGPGVVHVSAQVPDDPGQVPGDSGQVPGDHPQALDDPARVPDALRATPIPGRPFVDARAMGIDPLGNLYVADAGRDVVIRMDAEGRILTTIGGPGSGEGEFDDPGAVDPTNGLVLYVADTGNGRIQAFSRSHAWLGSIPLVRAGEESSARVVYRRRDEEPSDYATGLPVALVTSAANDLFAVDADQRVVVQWDARRRPLRVIGGVDAGSGMLVDPVDVCTGGGDDRLLFVADRGTGALMVYDHFGTFVRSIGWGRLTGLRAVAGVGEDIYAVLERTLVVFGRDGRFRRRIEVDGVEDMVDVASGPDGTLYVLGSTRAYVLASPE